MTLFHDDDIASAIQRCKQSNKILLVIVLPDGSQSEESTNTDVDRIENSLSDSMVAESLGADCVGVKLIDGSIQTTQFKQLFPITSVPHVSFIATNGQVLEKWEQSGEAEAPDLSALLKRAKEKQLQAMMSSMLMMAAMQQQQSLLSTQPTASQPNPQPVPINSEPLEQPATVSAPVPTITNPPPRPASQLQATAPPPPAKSVERNQAVERRRQEQLKKQAEKERIKQQILADRMESQLRSAQPPSAPSAGAALAMARSDSSSSSHASASANIAFRFPSGKMVRQSFSSSLTLGHVVKTIAKQESFQINQVSCVVPLKVFPDDDYNKSVLELGLAPSATLILKGEVTQSWTSSMTLLPSHLWNLFLRMMNTIKLFVFRAPPAAIERASSGSVSAEGSTAQSKSEPKAQPKTNAKGSSSSVQPRWSKMTTLSDLKPDEPDKPKSSGVNFWNGNSTEFGSNPDDGDDKNKKNQ